MSILTDAERAAAEQRAVTLLAGSLRAVEIVEEYNSRHPDRALRVDPLLQRAEVARATLRNLLCGFSEVDLEPLRWAEILWPDYPLGNVRLPQPAPMAAKRLAKEDAETSED